VKDESAATTDCYASENNGASLEKTFEIQKAGRAAAYDLENKRQELTDAITEPSGKRPSGIHPSCPSAKSSGVGSSATAEAQRRLRPTHLFMKVF